MKLNLEAIFNTGSLPKTQILSRSTKGTILQIIFLFYKVILEKNLRTWAISDIDTK